MAIGIKIDEVNTIGVKKEVRFPIPHWQIYFLLFHQFGIHPKC